MAEKNFFFCCSPWFYFLCRRMRYKKWTQSDDDYLREHYPDSATADVAKALGRTFASVKGRAKRIKIYKSKKFRDSDLSGRRKPGREPWNKGVKTGIVAVSLPIGTIRYHKGNDQHRIKTGPTEWRPYAEYVWKKAGNEVPEGHIVAIKDKSKEVTIDNLETVTRAELLNRYRIQRYPKEMHGLMIQIGRMRKELNSEQS